MVCELLKSLSRIFDVLIWYYAYIRYPNSHQYCTYINEYTILYTVLWCFPIRMYNYIVNASTYMYYAQIRAHTLARTHACTQTHTYAHTKMSMSAHKYDISGMYF